jgi:hypothetical protein
MPVNEQENILRNVGLNAGVHLVFLSDHAVKSDWLLDRVTSFMKQWPLQTVLCFLEPSAEAHPSWQNARARLSPRNVYAFSRRPSSSALPINDVDDLMVRLYSGFHTLLAS